MARVLALTPCWTRSSSSSLSGSDDLDLKYPRPANFSTISLTAARSGPKSPPTLHCLRRSSTITSYLALRPSRTVSALT